jgi:hypothetical protein
VRIYFATTEARLYGLGVLYDKIAYSSYGESVLLETTSITNSVPANTLFVIPNGGTYVLGNLLQVTYIPDSSAGTLDSTSRLLVKDVDYEEVDQYTIKVLKSLPANGTLLFRAALDVTKYSEGEFAWTRENLLSTVVSTDTFSLPGDQSTRKLEGRSIRLTNASGTTVTTHILSVRYVPESNETEIRCDDDHGLSDIESIFYGLSQDFAPWANSARPLIRVSPPGTSTPAKPGTMAIIEGDPPRLFFMIRREGSTYYWEEYVTIKMMQDEIADQIEEMEVLSALGISTADIIGG